MLRNEKLINFLKRMKMAEIILDLLQYQTGQYPFRPVPELQTWLDNELKKSCEVHELYDLSTQVEPRKEKDAKRYLS